MASRRRETPPLEAATPEKTKLLIKEDVDNNEAHAGPPPRWIGRASRRRPPDAAAKHQID
jgi:hypothetical protein